MQESDEANAVLQTERDLATACLKSDADGIEGVMEDYTLTNSMGKITKEISGGKPFDFQFQFTDTLVKDGGRLAFAR